MRSAPFCGLNIDDPMISLKSALFTAKNMVEEKLKDLDPRLIKQVDNAQKTLDRNPSYAIDVCMGILQRHPGCLEVRQILRKAQQRATGGKTSGLGRFINSVTAAPFSVKIGSLLKKDPKQAMEAAEKMISSQYNNASAHKMVGQAAEAMDLPETAVFAYECAHDLDPANVETALALGDMLVKAGRGKDAVRIGDVIMQDNPAHEGAQDLIRRASVAESMARGRWEEGGGFRDKLADETKSIELEQAARSVNDEDTLEQMTKKAIERLEKEPDNINLYREIIRNYRNLGKFEKAVEFLTKARELPTGKGDSTLEKMDYDIRLQSIRTRLNAKEEAFEKAPDDAKLKEELESLRQEEHAFRLENSKRMVERYPNDHAARFEYGQLLFLDGDFDGAIQQLQIAQRNPKVRTQALLFMGRAMISKGIHDLAVDQLKTAKTEVPLMNDLKKEIIYELARAYENMGDEKQAIEEYKLIYASDIAYKDVAEKINVFYSKS